MSYRHTVIGAMGSGRDFRRVTEETLTALDELPPEYRQLIDGPVTVVLATRRRDGRPTLSPVSGRGRRPTGSGSRSTPGGGG
jgi:hypothetical protein